MTTKTLAEALPEECARVRKVLGYYQEIGPTGMIATALIELDLRAAEKAIASGDVVAMLAAFKDLQEIKG